ncbi:phosphotransferase family protein [uncultured Friedmanniella sp.]|uniref:phosphotransferase family protein n=1 Tax=uncultured Friedmanniella sp. TaxID=335381 RepID=UPI0035CAE8F3
MTQHHGQTVVEKRFADPARREVEMLALRTLSDHDLPVPDLIEVGPDSILMTLMPGERLDSGDAELRLDRLRTSAGLLRRLHARRPPKGFPSGPDDAHIIRRYQSAGGPPLPLAIPPAAGPSTLCHGDWTDGNLLAVGTEITAVLDWEASHVGNPMREVSRAAWGASLKDPRSVEALVEGYGADLADVRAWFPIHAAELWLWFAEAGPPEYLDQLTEKLTRWP